MFYVLSSKNRDYGGDPSVTFLNELIHAEMFIIDGIGEKPMQLIKYSRLKNKQAFFKKCCILLNRINFTYPRRRIPYLNPDSTY